MPSRMTDAEIDARMHAIPAWRFDGAALVRTFECRTFDGSIAFVNQVAAAANAADHHPDIAIAWNLVTIRTWSHDAAGITDRDFTLAATLDAL